MSGLQTLNTLSQFLKRRIIYRLLIIRQLKYVTQQYNILSRDGETEIPVTIISPIRNPQNKIVLAVYGSYGIKFNYNYSPLIQSLIDNGIYFAYAHVRGGGEKGEKWHQAGMGINKINSIHDYLDVANGINRLVHRTKCKVIGMRASAGGFVVDSALNENPLSFAGIYISAPFISPLTAIKDVKTPVGEWICCNLGIRITNVMCRFYDIYLP